MAIYGLLHDVLQHIENLVVVGNGIASITIEKVIVTTDHAHFYEVPEVPPLCGGGPELEPGAAVGVEGAAGIEGFD
jgi:hypothetical protein